MNKTTRTMLMAAGLIVLAGCKTEVMRDRHFQGDPPQDDPTRQTQQLPGPMAEEKAAPPAAPAPKRGFTPMEGTYTGDGIEEETPRRRAPRRRAARGSVQRVAPGAVYIVKPGDTLGRIAYRHRVSVNALRQANNRTPAQDRFLRPGTKLVIPGGKGAAAAGKKSYAAPARRSGKRTPKLNSDGTYTMVRGDNIPKVARKFGIRARALQRANNLTDEETTRLQIGHKLIIPSGNAAAVAPRKKVRKAAAPRAAAAAPAAQPPAALPPQDNIGSAALPPPPPPPAPAGGETAAPATLPPPAPAAVPAPAANAGTDFMPVAGCNTIEEFAAKYNTTVAEVIRLNPQVDPQAPISTHGMLYVPRNAAK